MEILMNTVLVCLSIYLLRNFKRPIQQINANLYAGGATSGFLAGLTGTGGAIRGITLAAFHLPKSIFIATSALIDLGVDSSRAVIYLSNGYFHRSNWPFIPFLIVISVVGNYLGKIILKHTSETLFRYIVVGVVIGVLLFQVIKLLI